MRCFLILILIVSSSATESSSAAASQSSRHKRSDESSEPWKNRYLPDTVEPIFYDISLSATIHTNNTDFSGTMDLDINILNQTKTIIVHQMKLNITKAEIYDTSINSVIPSNWTKWEKNEYLVFEASQYLYGKLRLHFRFSGDMPFVAGSTREYSGVYNVLYTKDTGEQSSLMVTNFRSKNARYVFPCFDEPRFQAKFRIAMVHSDIYTVVSSIPVERVVNRNPGKTSILKVSPKMSTHNFILAVTDFPFKNKTVDGMEYRVFAQPNALNKVDYALNVTPTIVRFLQEELDVPYPIEKLDQLAVPGDLLDTQRESWGFVTYKESTLLYDATTGDNSVRFEVLRCIAHGVAHSYFGNLVSIRNWDHLWLTEGLALFYEMRVLAEVDPTVPFKEYFFGNKKIEDEMFVSAIYNLPLLEISAPPTYYRRDNTGVGILRMVEKFMGADTFNCAITEYLKQNANKTVVTDNLLDALQQAYGDCLDIKTIMKNWIEKGGHPVIKVELLSDNRIKATQARFIGTSPCNPNGTEKWYVPLTFRTKGGIEDLVWMNLTDAEFTIPQRSSDDWFVCNVDRTGYYRVSYDATLRGLLVKQLIQDHTVFTELTRSSLLSDALAFIKSKEQGYDGFLNLTKYASKESDMSVWLTIYDGIYDLKRIMRTTFFPNCQRYLLNLTSAMMDRLQVKEGGDYIERMLRPKIITLACAAGHTGCLDNSTRALRAWIENDQVEATASRDYLKAVYCAGMYNSMDLSFWDAAFEKYKRTARGVEKADILRALSCTRNVTLHERLLDYALNSTFEYDHKDTYTVIYVAYNPWSENIAWSWLKRNWEEIDRKMNQPFTAVLFPYVVQDFNTQAQYDEALAFGQIYPNASEIALDYVMSGIDGNIKWMAAHRDTLQNWFGSYA